MASISPFVCETKQKKHPSSLPAAAYHCSKASEPSDPEQRSSGVGGGKGEKEDSSQQTAAAAAEADALAARHRSLIQRKRRMRSALHVLRVSEKGKAALESAGSAGQQEGARVEEVMKV